MGAVVSEKLMGTKSRAGGFALLMVLMLITVAAVVGVSYLYGAQVKTASTCNLMLASQARYLAESGLQHGLYALQTSAVPFGSQAAPNGPYHIEAEDGGYVFYITSTATPTEYRIVATGTTEGITQTVAMTVRLTCDYAEKMTDLTPRFWWRLGDAGLTAVDEQGSNDGAYVNAVTRGAEGAFLGDTDTAAEFRGSNDYVNLGQMTALDDTGLSFGCWARADAWASANPRLMSRSSGTTWDLRRWELSVTSTRKLRFTLRLDDFVYEMFGNTSIQLGEWFFVVATFNKDARQMRLYMNGEPDGTWNGTLDAHVNDIDTLEVWIGDCPSLPGQRPWEGPIDEVFIASKNATLTPEQVKELYDASIPNVEIISWDD
jgi:hypothetical protein